MASPLAVRRLAFDAFVDERGCLIPIEYSDRRLPFLPVRSFVILDVPAGKNRAGHALTCHEILILIRGGVRVMVVAGSDETGYLLERPGAALFVPQNTSISLRDFSGDAVLLVLASGPYVKR